MKVLFAPPRQDDPFLQGLAAALRDEEVVVKDLDRPNAANLVAHRMAGFRILHLQGLPVDRPRRLHRLLRWAALLRIHVVWNIGATLPRSGRAEDVDTLRTLYHAAKVRIVSGEDVRSSLRTDFGLDGTTFIIPPTEPLPRLATGFRLAYETSLEPRVPILDLARPPRA